MIGAQQPESVVPHHLRSVDAKPVWDTVRDTAMGRYHFEHEYGFISRYLQTARQPRRILDIACGSGWMSLPLHRAGFKVIGVDLNRQALAQYQRLANHTVPLVAADALSLPFADKSFDWVIAIECFEYFPQYRQFLQMVNRVLVNGGLLIFDTLNRRSYKWRLKALLGRPLSYPTPNVSCDDVLRATASHGFTIQEACGYNWVPFKKESNSRLLPVAARIEKTFKLDRCFHLSPRILVAATKTASCDYL